MKYDKLAVVNHSTNQNIYHIGNTDTLSFYHYINAILMMVCGYYKMLNY